MERGQQNVTLLTLWLVSQAVGVKPAALFDEDFAATAAEDISESDPPS